MPTSPRMLLLVERMLRQTEPTGRSHFLVLRSEGPFETYAEAKAWIAEQEHEERIYFRVTEIFQPAGKEESPPQAPKGTLLLPS